MQVRNEHRRVINLSLEETRQLFATLASENDRWWPHEEWPAMFFKEGKKVQSYGGHGIIRYFTNHTSTDAIEFTFKRPKGFHGVHGFKLTQKSESQTEVFHYIHMQAKDSGLLKWVLAIRPLHDALMENCFDKLEGLRNDDTKKMPYSMYVRLIRRLFGLNN